MQTLLPPSITMSLYFVIFGNLIGKRIGQMNGYDYMQFIAPGLIMMSVITQLLWQRRFIIFRGKIR